MPNFRAVVDEPIPAKYIRTALSLTSKLNLVIVKPPKLDSFVQLRGVTSATNLSHRFFVTKM